VKMPKSMKTPSLANEEAYIAPPNFTGIFALDHPLPKWEREPVDLIAGLSSILWHVVVGQACPKGLLDREENCIDPFPLWEGTKGQGECLLETGSNGSSLSNPEKARPYRGNLSERLHPRGRDRRRSWHPPLQTRPAAGPSDTGSSPSTSHQLC